MNAKYRNFVLFTLLMVALLIVFEACQQYYYILQFDLVPLSDFTFTELMIGQAYRWLIWLMITLTYFGTIIYRGQSDELFKITRLSTTAIHFVLLITTNVVITAILRIIINDLPMTIESLWDNCVFYFFQKTPIYTLAHGAMVGMLHLVNSNQNLEIEILDLKNKNESEPTDNPQALSIKIGMRNKIIPLSDIVWIEAYDYCVKIHTVSQHAYAMRNSLKALEKRLLSHQFLRVHRKAIVNMNKVSEVTYNSSSYLTLDNHTKVDIAQSRVKSIKTFFN
ncbi:MAG: LytTR family DNA-binding domain-containing protein [Reichenbachiella sp.]|uniref:LytR/AlgR family response regulator transcription factor n=1 Tax=Reichenbachiella sp. TaxID=2184521 RepID=UPI003265840C